MTEKAEDLIARLRNQSTEIGDRADVEDLMNEAADRLAALATPQERDAFVDGAVWALSRAAAPESEWEYRLVLFETEGGEEWDSLICASEQDALARFEGWVDAHYQDAEDTFAIERRRKAGPWEPVGGEGE